MIRALFGFVVSALVGFTGLSFTPAPAAAQYVQFGIGFGDHYGPRHYRHRHWRHAPRHFRPYRHHYRGHYRRHHHGYYPRPVYRYYRPYVDLTIPVVPRYVRPRYPVRQIYRLSPAHYDWCHARYRSYRAYDNSFQPYRGGRRQCYSPYS